MEPKELSDTQVSSTYPLNGLNAILVLLFSSFENIANCERYSMKVYISLLFILFMGIQGCSMKQVTQAVYDSAKGDECMKKTGTIECDLNQ